MKNVGLVEKLVLNEIYDITEHSFTVLVFDGTYIQYEHCKVFKSKDWATKYAEEIESFLLSKICIIHSGELHTYE